MTAQLLDGRALAKKLQAQLAEETIDFLQNNSATPCLAAVLIGDNPASEVYVRHKQQACQRVGMESQLHRLPAHASEEDVLKLLGKLNKDEEVHGILVQLPLPDHIASHRVLQAVHPLKDVDAFHPENVGLLVQGRPRFLPCTPRGVVALLDEYRIPLSGKHVVILGRSEIVGKPLALMLLARGRDATVTVCHSRSTQLAELTRQADILVAAIGQPRFVRSEMLRPGAVVVDVGINRLPEGLCGDVDFAAASEVADWITPVPGGVGPLTVTMLLENTLAAARHASR